MERNRSWASSTCSLPAAPAASSSDLCLSEIAMTNGTFFSTKTSCGMLTMALFYWHSFVSARWHWFDSFCSYCSTERQTFLPSSAQWNVLSQLFKCACSSLLIVPVRQVTKTGEDASIHLLCSSCPWSNLRSSVPPNLHHYCSLHAFPSESRAGRGYWLVLKLQLRESWTRRRRRATRVIKNSLPIENRRWDFDWMFSVH